MPLFSIVVPVYNVAQYLPACLDSILAQDAEAAYEVILVDDGSTDGSGAVCDDYAARRGNFRVIHQENSGVSAARNAGLRAAAGAYVLFCDGDDLYEPCLLATLAPLLETRPDIVLFCGQGFFSQGPGPMMQPAIFPQQGGENGRAYLQRFFDRGLRPPANCTVALYRRAYLEENHLSFRTDLFHGEDLDFNLECLSRGGTVTGTEAVLYHRRLHSESASARPLTLDRVLYGMWFNARWFRRYPVSTFANEYCYWLLRVADFGTPEEAQPLIRNARENADILDKVTGRRERIARFLIRRLGVYRGSAVMMALIHLYHRLINQPEQ